MITEPTRKAAYEYADGLYSGRLLKQDQRRELVDGVVRVFENEVADVPDIKPSAWLVKREVKNDTQIKKFIPVWILIAIGGWIISKILDWLWDKWNNRQRGTTAY